MTRRTTFGLLIVAALGFGGCCAPRQSTEESESTAQIPLQSLMFGKNTSFTIEGTLTTLVNGVSSASIENSSSRTTTRYLGREVEGDLNGDGLDDFSFWVAQDAGGSGTFYYVVVALQNPSGYTTTNAFLVGDRITPESMRIRSDARELHVSFIGRACGDPMTAPPSEPKVLLLKVTPNGVLEGLMG